jgi:uncharacterized membrane protein YuzA (DUF378 family)
MSSIIQELNRELNTGKKIDVNIKALEKGSFLIHIDLVETVLGSLKNLLTRENVETAAAIITSIAGIITIGKFLKGKKEKSREVAEDGSRVKIENEDGDVIYVENFTYNVYEKNVTVRDALSQSFESLENDNSITGYEITDSHENTIVRVEKKEFEYLAVKSEEVSDGERVVIVAARLNIVKVSFDSKLKWEFIFKGNKISAKANDPVFQEQVDKGEAFAKGDVLEVELEIKQKFDPTVNTFLNKSYKIKKIIKHIKRDVTLTLNFGE